MIILGIDPGDTLIGFGVLKKSGALLEIVDYGCLKTNPGSAPEKLRELEDRLEIVLDRYNPDILGIEELFFFKNSKTVIRVAQARGVIMALCVRRNIRILEFTPLQIKQAVTGYGRAEKKQVQRMLEIIFQLKKPLKQDDAADALAAAWCAAQSHAMLDALRAQK